MATTRAPKIFDTVATPEGAGEVALQKFSFDFADTSYSGAIAQNDKLQIGLVPKGHKLVPHLCRLDMLAIDTNGSPTGDYSIGDDTTTTALKGSTASETAAATYSGEDWALSTAEIGSNTADTPIYIYAINASATTPSTGKINFWQVIRPFDSNIDSAS
jgi:hypothetical protein